MYYVRQTAEGAIQRFDNINNGYSTPYVSAPPPGMVARIEALSNGATGFLNYLYTKDVFFFEKQWVPCGCFETGSTDYLRRLKASLDEQLVLKTALEKERHELTRESRRLETAFAERESRRRKEVDQALQRIESEFRAESERLVATIKDRAEAARARRTAAKGGAELRKAADRLRLESSAGPAPHPASAPGEKSQPPAPRTVPDEIREGDRVAITPLGKEGVVESIQAEEYSVQVGVLRFRARRDELRPVLTAAMAGLKAPIDAFFESVLVMDPDDSTRNNRLALLTRIRNLFARVADFRKIQTTS